MTGFQQQINSLVGSSTAFGTSLLDVVINIPLAVLRAYLPYIAFGAVIAISLVWAGRWLKGRF